MVIIAIFSVVNIPAVVDFLAQEPFTYVFAWPGLGRYITNSLLNADMNAVLGGTLVVGAVFIGVNLFSDILGRLVDPRTR